MWGHPGFFPFGFFFFLLIVGLIIFAMTSCRQNRYWHGRPMNHGVEPLELLKQRLAKGEINEEDYLRLKEVLTK